MEHHFNIRLRERFPEYSDPEATRRHIWHRIRVAIVVGSSRVDLQACKLEYSIVSPK